MPFPAGLTVITVTGQIAIPPLPSPQAIPDVIFESLGWLQGPADDAFLPPFAVDAEVDSTTGEFSVQLPPTNDPQWTAFEYKVTLRYGNKSQSGTLTVPYDGGSFDLADRFNPDDVPVPGPAYMLLASRGVALGVAALDADGDVTNAAGVKITGGGGGGAPSGPAGGVLAGTYPNPGFAASPSFTGTVAAAGQANIVGPLAIGASGTILIGADTNLYRVGAHALATDDSFAVGGDLQVFGGLNVDGATTGIDKADVGLGNVNDTSDANKPISTAMQTALDLKAPIASPALTGNPTAPTQTAGNNSTRLATTAFVTTAVAGAGGSALVVKRAIVTSGNITPQNTSGSWAALTGGPTLTIPAAVGDYISAEIMGALNNPNAATFYELAVLSAASLVRYGSTGTGTPAVEGEPGWYPAPGTFLTLGGPVMDFVATSGDIDGGNITIVIATKSAGFGTLYAGADFPFRWRVLNYGPASVS